MKLISQSDTTLVKKWFDEGLPPEKIAWIFLTAHLTEQDPSAVKVRLDDLHDEVKDLVYGTKRAEHDYRA